MIPFHFRAQPVDGAKEEGVVLPAELERKADLLAFLGRAIPLPEYFGQNWDALEECLGDLDWLDRRKLVLIHQDIPMKTPGEQKIYLQILAGAAGKSDRLVIIFPEGCRKQISDRLSTGSA